MRTTLLKIVALAALCLTLVVVPAGCGSAQNPPPTAAAQVADVATKIQQSANVILHATQNATQIVIPSTGKPLVTEAQLDQVALAVNKLGHLGQSLDSLLKDYSAAKKAGGDLTALSNSIRQAVADVTAAVSQITTAIPKGTLQQVDSAVASILEFLVTIKGSL